MKNSIYKLTLNKDHEHTCLQLNSSNQIVRKWYGAFAELIFDNALIKSNNITKNINTAYLNKIQIHAFFTEITCLYQMVLFHFNIEKDLSLNNFPKNSRNIAESILLQIRINPVHLCYEDLQSYFLDEFINYDISYFDNTLKLLIRKKLIQLIVTEDGQEFLDKNTKPHDHIYFKQHKKLVDCSQEISNFLSASHFFNKSKLTDATIFYVNKELS